jgi:hypothetical protein
MIFLMSLPAAFGIWRLSQSGGKGVNGIVYIDFCFETGEVDYHLT